MKVRILNNSINRGWNVGDEVEIEAGERLFDLVKGGFVLPLEQTALREEAPKKEPQELEVVSKEKGEEKVYGSKDKGIGKHSKRK